MNTINKIDRNTCKILSEQIKDALSVIEDTFGVHISLKNGRFDSTNFTVPVSISITDKDGIAQTPERKNWDLFAESYHLNPDWIGRDFWYKGSQFKIIGILTRSRRYPVLCQSSKGRIKFTADLIRGILMKDSDRQISDEITAELNASNL